MAKDPEFVILREGVGWLPEKEAQNILGAVVKNPLSPQVGSNPKYPELYMDDEPIEDEFDDFILRKEQISSSNFKVNVRGLGKLRWTKSSGHNVDLCGKKVFVRRMKQHEEYWSRMTAESPDFAERVLKWVREKRMLRRQNQVCLVVGLLMCQDVVVAISEDERQAWSAQGLVPLGTVAQYAAAASGACLPTGGTGDVAAQASRENAQRTYFKATGKGTRIFALELMAVSPKLELTNTTLKFERKSGPGHVDDLMPKDLSEEEWASLIHDEEVGNGGETTNQ